MEQYNKQIGQITRNDNFGQLLYSLAKQENIQNIVEIGTWYGTGSTKCIIDGLLERKQRNYKFITIELYKKNYDISKQNLQEYLNENIIILNGTIIKYKDIFWFDHTIVNTKKDEHALRYYHTDLHNLKEANNVLHQLPERIDLLILDGGEYTTYPEYKILKNRTRLFALDDVLSLKCLQIRKELLKENIKIVHEDLNTRYGWGVYGEINV